ncbi:hypothetical protein BSKO_10229 [Bryopsis sp. KO-2023]|nr:hypothetical protein BSKO_10229 [Bryopsis sp. KO-2023]
MATRGKGGSEHVAHKLEALDERCPSGWKGKMVRYNSLVDTLDVSTTRPDRSQDTEQEFFGKLFREIEKVNAQFRSAAKAVISAYRRKSWWKMFLPFGNKKVKIGANADGVELTPEVLALHTQICLEYAQVSAEVLRKIAEDHDKAFGNEHGRIILDSMWKTHSGIADFLHSPLLTELEAVARTFGLGDGPVGCREDVDGCDSKDVTGNAECDEDEALQCPICLDTLYKPVGLACGHKFCAPCVMKATSSGRILTNPNATLSSISHKARCPQCRQSGVFKNASVLTVLEEGLRAKFPKYWSERQREERQECRRAKEAVIRHLESRGFVYPSVFAFM